MKKNLITAAKYGFFLGLGIFLVWWAIKDFTADDKANIMQAFRQANYWWLLPSAVCALASHLSRAMRWQMMIAPIAHKPSTANSFLAVMIGYLANLAFPRLGEITRCGVLNRYEKISLDKLLGTVITERAIDLVVLLLLTAIVLLTQLEVLGSYFSVQVFSPLQNKFTHIFSGDSLFSLLLIVGIGLVVALLFYLMRNWRESVFYTKIQGILAGVWKGIQSVRQMKNFPLFIGHTAFIWLMYFMMTYICFSTMEATSLLPAKAGLSVMVMGGFAMIATQGGIGAYQIVVASILTLYAVEYSTAYAFAWVMWTAQTILLLLVGLLSVIMLPIVNSSAIAENEEKS